MGALSARLTPQEVKGDDGNYGCGIVRETPDEEMRAAAGLLIGIGIGCDARINGEPVNEKFEAKMQKLDRFLEPLVREARDLWEIP